MDGFLQTPPGQSREAHSSKMAPVSPASSCSEPEQPTLADIGAEIRRLAANMVTKSDLQSLTTTLTASLTSAVTALRTDMEAQDSRIQALETQAQATQRQASAADTALTRQGNMLLALRRQVEDLDNRSRRSNIRVRGMPEGEETENVVELLTALFCQILGNQAPPDIRFERAHRALRPRNRDGDPRDIICCLHSFPLKERIMQRARTRPTWRYQEAEVSLYNDLSPTTLEARRALRPITTALRERNIPYKWGFPFSIQVRHHNEWIAARWPEEIPRFLQRLELPSIAVPDWILEPLDREPRPQRQPRNPRRGPRENRTPDIPPHPSNPEE
ncbi:Hypothetical predicted protein [Pelobates cultripes]|uniref:L1 transposable element RRM domain-containing protein n=1 Tax=Pelobates cultripes TaxID=61616 RepID=A0AAD1RDF0_PELCU|nr:Hypothetical predicted protein [Pelobates cultripes]